MSYQQQVDEVDDSYQAQTQHYPPPQAQQPYGYVPPQPQGSYQNQAYGQQPYGQSYGQPYQPPQPGPYDQPYGQQAYQQPNVYSQPTYGQPQDQHIPPQDYQDDGKFPEKTAYRDWPWALLFIGHLIAVLVILGTSANSKSGDNNNATEPSDNPDSDDFLPWDSIGKAFLVCFLGAMAAVGFSVMYLAIIKRYASQLIKFTLFAGIAWCLILAIIGFAQGALWVGIVFLLCAGINALFFYFWRQRIPFATAVLTTVARILDAYPAPSYYAYGSLLIQTFWVMLWVPTIVFIQRFDSTTASILSIFLVFSFYWVSQVIKNVVHVTASGLFATWYFLSGVGMPRNPTRAAFKRATTSSFGSICLGSLLVAILKTLRQIVSSRRGGNSFIACVASCILAILDQLIEYFNLYAFTQVAIYGKTYCQAAKDTWTLVKSRGVDAIVNDNLISGVLVMGAIIGGIATAVIGGIIALIAIEDFWIPLAFICFCIGVSLVMLSMEVVESGVCTIFVCFAMDPQALQRNDPALHAMFVSTYSGLQV